MIFLAYVSVFGAYLAVTALALLYLPMRFKQRRQRLSVFAAMLTLFVLAPGGWIYYERSYFDNLCEKEAGVKIYRRVDGVEGFMVQGGAETLIADLPYRFLEDRLSNGKVWRHTLDAQSRPVLEKNQIPRSNYAYRAVHSPVGAHDIEREDLYIFDLKTDRPIAVKVSFLQGGDWFRPWLFPVRSCDEDKAGAWKDFVLSVLRPATTATTDK